MELRSGELRDYDSVGEWRILEIIEDMDGRCRYERGIDKIKIDIKNKNRMKLTRIN